MVDEIYATIGGGGTNLFFALLQKKGTLFAKFIFACGPCICKVR